MPAQSHNRHTVPAAKHLSPSASDAIPSCGTHSSHSRDLPCRCRITRIHKKKPYILLLRPASNWILSREPAIIHAGLEHISSAEPPPIIVHSPPLPLPSAYLPSITSAWHS